MIYFDWSATTPPDSSILQEALDFSSAFYGNPSSIHRPGIESAKALKEQREKAAYLFSVKTENIIFTSGATESNNLIILSLLNRPSKGTILVCAADHPSTYNPVQKLQSFGYAVKEIALNRDGLVNLNQFRSLLSSDIKFVSCIAVNNETGAVQPINEISRIINDFGTANSCSIHFHSDFVQAIGKIDIKEIIPSVDSFSLSGHKIYGPKGVGLLYLKTPYQPLLTGGGQESNLRSGTEDLFGIHSLVQAVEQNINKDTQYISTLKTLLYNKLSLNKRRIECISDEIYFSSKFVPHICCTGFKGMPSEVLCRLLSDKGFYISPGSACSTRHSKISPGIISMGVNKNEAGNFVRISLSNKNTADEVEQLCSAIMDITDKFAR